MKINIVALLAIIPLTASAVGGPHILPKRDGTMSVFSAPSGATLTYYGGRVISNVEVVQVLWGQGNYLPQVTSTGTPSMKSFYTNVLKSPYVDWLVEYNTPASRGTNQTIGHGTFLGQYQITPSSRSTSIDDTTIQAEISAQIRSGKLPKPSTDAGGNSNTYYAIYFPAGTTISLSGQGSCQVFCAYHGTVAATSTLGEYYYGVHPDFQAGSGCDVGCGSSASTYDNVTSVASHEVIEAVTDAEVGLAQNLAPPLAWYNNSYGEIGDICNADQGRIVGADGYTYTVQKEYSNQLKDCIVSKASAPQDFKASASPSSQTVSAGSSATYSVVFTAINGLTGTLSSSCAGGPAGTTCQMSPSSTTLNGSSTIKATLKTTATARKGTFNVIFRGQVGGTTRYAYGTITVR